MICLGRGFGPNLRPSQTCWSLMPTESSHGPIQDGLEKTMKRPYFLNLLKGKTVGTHADILKSSAPSIVPGISDHIFRSRFGDCALRMTETKHGPVPSLHRIQPKAAPSPHLYKLLAGSGFDNFGLLRQLHIHIPWRANILRCIFAIWALWLDLHWWSLDIFAIYRKVIEIRMPGRMHKRNACKIWNSLLILPLSVYSAGFSANTVICPRSFDQEITASLKARAILELQRPLIHRTFLSQARSHSGHKRGVLFW